MTPPGSGRLRRPSREPCSSPVLEASGSSSTTSSSRAGPWPAPCGCSSTARRRWRRPRGHRPSATEALGAGARREPRGRGRAPGHVPPRGVESRPRAPAAHPGALPGARSAARCRSRRRGRRRRHGPSRRGGRSRRPTTTRIEIEIDGARERVAYARHRAGPHGVRVGSAAEAGQAAKTKGGQGRPRQRPRREGADVEVDGTRLRQADEDADAMNSEMMEALDNIEREKGISVEIMLEALANALVTAYKRMPDAAEEALVEIDIETGDIQRHRAGARRRGQRRPRVGRHPERLRSHRRADREAGDPPADPRRRARDEVRGVRRPRRRHRHRHHPADRPALHAARPRPGRGAAARRPSRPRTSATSTGRASRRTSSRSARRPRAPRSSCRARTPAW